MVGTMVRDRKYEASMAKTTASASGTKRYLRNPAQKKHRHKHDADGKRGDEGRNGNLRRAIQNGLLDLLAHLQIAIDVFNLDRGVVDQNADRQRQSTQRHDVDGLAQRAQHDQRNQNRTAEWKPR